MKPAKTVAPQIATASRLRDGAVVFLAGRRSWSTDIDASLVAIDAASAERLLAAANQMAADQVVVGPYLIDVSLDGETIQPLVYRERIRAFGPSIAASAPARLNAG